MEKRWCLLRIFSSILIVSLLIFGPSTGVLADSPPIFDALAITDVWDLSVRAKARISVENAALISSKGFCWSTGEQPVFEDNAIIDDSTGTNLLSVKIINLVPGTTYYLRPFVEDVSGRHYGEQISFTTLSNVVRVDDDWVGTEIGADPDGPEGPATNFGTDSFATILEAFYVVMETDNTTIMLKMAYIMETMV